MQHDLGYFEEGQLDKAYDLRLLKRMLPFLVPYRMWLVLSVGIVVTLTVMDLALPYLTKIAIDRHIVPAIATPAEGNPGTNRVLTVPAADPAVPEHNDLPRKPTDPCPSCRRSRPRDGALHPICAIV